MARKKKAVRRERWEEPPELSAAEQSQMLTESARCMLEFSQQLIGASQELGAADELISSFALTADERAVLQSGGVDLPPSVRAKLQQPEAAYTIPEVAAMLQGLSAASAAGDIEQRALLLTFAVQIADALHLHVAEEDDPPAGRTAPRKPAAQAAGSDTVYQFKITLCGTDPPIWRRIQVRDCTLEQLHICIQASMGWTNSHMYQFLVEGECYGGAELAEGSFDDCYDASTVNISDIIPPTARKRRFTYEYDFGDSWEHEVLFERRLKKDPACTYPLCVDGQLACPPEDIGGVYGYYDLLETLEDERSADDDDDDDDDESLEWLSDFDPDKFDAQAATKAMQSRRFGA